MEETKRPFIVNFARPFADEALLKRYQGVHPSDASDVMEHLNATDARIRLMTRPDAPTAVGTAFTVRLERGDNLMLHAAMRFAGEHDFIVVETAPGEDRAMIGEIMLTYLFRIKRIAGFLIDGPIRDLDALASSPWPVYAQGATPLGPIARAGGSLNVSVTTGGMSVNPGDLIVADADGAACVPLADAAALIQRIRNYEQLTAKRLCHGRLGTVDFGWLEAQLEKNIFSIRR